MLTLTRINKIRLLVAGKHPWIDRMLDHRESLIKKYMTLLDLKIRGVEDCPPSYTKVEDFCSELMDYLSSGHFDIYPRIVTVMENATGRRLAIAQRIIPRIRHNTDLILSFDDKYGEELNEAKMKDLREDLNRLGPILDTRFTLEDRLMAILQCIDDLIKDSARQTVSRPKDLGGKPLGKDDQAKAEPDGNAG